MSPAYTLTLLLVVSACSREPMSYEEFSKLYQERLTQTLPETHSKVHLHDDGEYSVVTVFDGDTLTSFLGNAYRKYLSDSDSLEPILRRHIGLVETNIRNEALKYNEDNLIATLKPLAYAQEYGSFQVPFAGDLVITLCLDESETIQFLLTSDLANFVRPEADLLRIGINNFLKYYSQPEVKDIGNNTFQVLLDNGYLPSLVFDTIFWNEQAKLAKDSLLLILPARDFMYFTRTSDERSTRHLRSLIQQTSGQPYLLSNKIFVFKDSTFQLFSE